MRKTFSIMMAINVLLSVTLTACAARNEAKILDNTNTTFGWEVLNDKPPVPTLEVVSGPKAKTKALRLNYQFSEGIWIALVKNVSLSLGPEEGVRFYYEGSGAAVNLKIKISDASGTVFGYTVPAGTNSPVWKEVVIPRGVFSYLWGGSGASGMNWSSINKIEFTLDVDKIAIKPETAKPGTLLIYSLSVVDASDVKVPVAEVVAGISVQQSFKALKGKDGFYMIHKMFTPDGWTSVADQDGKVELSSKVVIVGQNTTKATKIDYDFGSQGIWNAVVLPMNLDLSQMKLMRFMFKGEGGANQMVMKIADANGTAFGYTIPYTTDMKEWKNVLISKDQLHYLYGGSGAGGMDWSHIQKIEITLEKRDDKKKYGTVYMRRLQFN